MLKRDYDVMQFDDNGGSLKLPEDIITEGVFQFFSNRSVNTRERFPIRIYDGKCVLMCYIEKI